MSEQSYALKPLEDAVASHVGGGTPPRQVSSYWKGDVPWASVKDFPESAGVISETEEHISRAGLNASASNLIPAGTPLVCTRMAVGRAALPVMPIAINQDVKAIFPASDVSATYLLKLLQFIQPQAEAQAVGSTVKGIRIQDYLNIPVPLAPPEAQPVIARVLDTLDTAILETVAIIDKLKAVKQGLLHDLLTRGIDANGELRPPQPQAPQLYKNSPLGWVPKEWDVFAVGDEAEIEHGFAFPGEGFTSDSIGPALLVPGNFHRDGGLYFTAQNTKHFLGKYPKSSVLKNGDVLVVMTDLSPMTLILGRTVVLDEKFTVLHNQRIGKFRFKAADQWNSIFFATVMNSDVVRNKVIAEATGTTVRHTSPDRIKSCLIAKPPIGEQYEISKRIVAVATRQENEQSEYLKLTQQKSGLMDDLLTGRVRVTVLSAAFSNKTDDFLLQLCSAIHQAEENAVEEYRREYFGGQYLPQLLVMSKDKVRIEIRKENVNHNEPHLHITHSDKIDVSLSLRDFAILAGKIDRKSLKHFLGVLTPVKARLMAIWNELNEKDNSVAAEALISDLGL